MFDCGKQLIICFDIDKHWNLWGFDMYKLLSAYRHFTFPSWNYFKIVNIFTFEEYTAGMQRFYQMSTLCWQKWEYLVSGMVQMLHRNKPNRKYLGIYKAPLKKLNWIWTLNEMHYNVSFKLNKFDGTCTCIKK